MSDGRFHSSAVIYGIAFIVLGTLFLFDEWDMLDLDAAIVIPMLLIGLGCGVIGGARTER